MTFIQGLKLFVLKIEASIIKEQYFAHKGFDSRDENEHYEADLLRQDYNKIVAKIKHINPKADIERL